MTTPRDLLMIALDEPDRPPEPGEVSLALAGAELIDLLDVQAIRLDNERIVPIHRPATGDRMLDEAATSLAQQEPYESVGDWLWRRGRGLFSAYLAALETEGQITLQRRRWRVSQTGRMMLVDSSAHRAAAKRWTSGDAVLAALAAIAGTQGERRSDFPGISDIPVARVLAAVDAAVTDLGLERQRRAIEGDAFDNVWRVV